jgi:hypothetical protein
MVVSWCSDMNALLALYEIADLLEVEMREVG